MTYRVFMFRDMWMYEVLKGGNTVTLQGVTGPFAEWRAHRKAKRRVGWYR